MCIRSILNQLAGFGFSRHKSIALNVTLQAFDKTLNEHDLEQLSQKIISTIKEKTGAIIRS